MALDDGQVSFTRRNYRNHAKIKVVTLSANEFIRRFLQHIVPHGFHRIRNIGFVADRLLATKLARCHELPAQPPQEPLPALARSPYEFTGQDIVRGLRGAQRPTDRRLTVARGGPLDRAVRCRTWWHWD
jgi:hypothetical protein